MKTTQLVESFACQIPQLCHIVLTLYSLLPFSSILKSFSYKLMMSGRNTSGEECCQYLLRSRKHGLHETPETRRAITLSPACDPALTKTSTI